ncbi:probably inactive leucine-rich repeat receptor-like protein kinase imk2 [Phtheirospermum japonicum]|uniref:Probably inactive leucine-rich repeat receptor-like protein kinase imk2 n=1 Tax=Phtheirospermum japonicum TaxID=374723 RepID=A0A830BKJ5_9LAMI|nr:probably inactive leucine-rich repeat receptor-like protein kinase imk2 [Phtheirospermum japonicum]
MPKPKPKPTFSTIFILLILSLSSSPQIHSFTFPGDIAALRALKSAVKPSTIPATSCLATWNFSAADPCAVPRVTHFTCAVTCDAGRVVQLTLDSQGYAGTLTPHISKLTQLVNFDLGENKFSGEIPSSISFLPNLRTLILGANSFSGSVPPSIANLKSLETLDLSRNSLSGPLPDLNKLALLTRLDLSYNKLTGSIPRLPPNLNESPASELVAVDLSYNKFEGYLPVNFSEYPLLRSLSLSHNRFRGPIPWQYSRKGSPLRRLYLDGNFLNGSPPAGFFSGGDPVFGSLGDNCLQGCPTTSELCSKSQKSASICQQAYGGKQKS